MKPDRNRNDSSISNSRSTLREGQVERGRKTIVPVGEAVTLAAQNLAHVGLALKDGGGSSVT
jgi:hypothetical protein